MVGKAFHSVKCTERGRGRLALSIRKSLVGPCGQQTGAGETGVGKPRASDEEMIQGQDGGSI